MIENKKCDLPIDDVVIDRDIFMPCDGIYKSKCDRISNIIQMYNNIIFYKVL